MTVHAECQMGVTESGRGIQRKERRGRAVFLEEGDLGAEADLERWVGMTQGSSRGGYFRKSNQKQAECEAGNSNHLQCGGGGTSQEKSRRRAGEAGSAWGHAWRTSSKSLIFLDKDTGVQEDKGT